MNYLKILTIKTTMVLTAFLLILVSLIILSTARIKQNINQFCLMQIQDVTVESLDDGLLDDLKNSRNISSEFSMSPISVKSIISNPQKYKIVRYDIVVENKSDNKKIVELQFKPLFDETLLEKTVGISKYPWEGYIQISPGGTGKYYQQIIMDFGIEQDKEILRQKVKNATLVSTGKFYTQLLSFDMFEQRFSLNVKS